MVLVNQPTKLTGLMMAPEVYEAAPPAPALERTSPPGASDSGTAEPEGRAPLRWPFRTREQQARAQQRAAEHQISESSSESSEESEGERGQGDCWRVAVEEAGSDEEQSSAGSPAAALDENAAAQNQPPDVPESMDLEEALAARAPIVFSLDAAEPAASGLPPLSPRRCSRGL